LTEAHRAVVPIFDAPKPPARRLSLTLPILTGAGRIVVMAFGKSKSAAIGEALVNDQSVLPLALVVRRAARVLVLLDEAAAAALQRRRSL
jgi:6-phosphogluconolactonase